MKCFIYYFHDTCAPPYRWNSLRKHPTDYALFWLHSLCFCDFTFRCQKLWQWGNRLWEDNAIHFCSTSFQEKDCGSQCRILHEAFSTMQILVLWRFHNLLLAKIFLNMKKKALPKDFCLPWDLSGSKTH